MITQENIPYTVDEIKAMVKTIEELRKKYNEALGRAKDMLSYKEVRKEDMEYLFPELAESEDEILEDIFPELVEDSDERIKKEIVDFITSSNKYGTNERCEAWLAWLEKQCVQKITRKREIDDAYLQGICDAKHEIEKHGESTITNFEIPFGASDSELQEVSYYIPEGFYAEIKDDKVVIKKVEPKFKVGDWLQYRYAEPFLVEEITEQGYCNGNSCLPFEWEDEIHLWTIQDAKDGDLIYVSTEVKGIQAIFHKFENGIIYFHCNLCSDFTQGGYEPSGDVEFVSPLPKIHYQRFFQKMKEAGYEWNADKKESKKIEQKTLNADEVIEWMGKHVIDWKGQDLIRTFTPNSPAGKSYIVEQFKQDFGL